MCEGYMQIQGLQVRSVGSSQGRWGALKYVPSLWVSVTCFTPRCVVRCVAVQFCGRCVVADIRAKLRGKDISQVATNAILSVSAFSSWSVFGDLSALCSQEWVRMWTRPSWRPSLRPLRRRTCSLCRATRRCSASGDCWL